MDDSVRPVRLRKVVLSYNFIESKQSDFQFDLSLSYKLAGIINTYCEGKPTLVFCSTRKSTMQGADILSKDVKSSYVRNAKHRQHLMNFSCHIKDSKLRDLVVKGIGYHHAGMDLQDRKHMEEIFSQGDLPVLVATSTLAMGVNLPAHLVIVKSTMYYHMGTHQEYPDTQVLQMIGRAGRPQFDTSATAVIMTKHQTKMKYDNLLNGTQLIESSLHKNLVEHLNAEIVLRTISDVSVAVEWLKYTFLYIRVRKNPGHYGMPHGLSRASIDKRLQDMCVTNLNKLASLNLIDMDNDDMAIKPTESGRLMARYCVSFKTAELFLSITGTETNEDMLSSISKCEEFADIQLRNNEKKTLNTLNKDKNRLTIRFPMTGKIKTTEMKVNCLIQASLGCLPVQDFSLQQDTSRIFRAGVRVTRCLVELLSQRNNFKSLLTALQLCKCFKAKLWENSKYVSKQLEGIGPTLSTALVNAGLTSFEKIEATNPREIELIVNRHPPFGNQVIDSVTHFPKYELVIEQVTRYSETTAEVVISIQLTNRDSLKDRSPTGHCCTLLIGDQDNKLVHRQKVMDALLLKEDSWSKRLTVIQAEKGPELFIHYISQEFVGLDIDCSYTPNYLGSRRVSSSTTSRDVPQPQVPAQHITSSVQPCSHNCLDKSRCGHGCCKNGVGLKRKQKLSSTTQPTIPSKIAGCIKNMRSMAAKLPMTPTINKKPRLQMQNDAMRENTMDLSRFAYNRDRSRYFQDDHDDDMTNPKDQHLSVRQIPYQQSQQCPKSYLGQQQRGQYQAQVYQKSEQPSELHQEYDDLYDSEQYGNNGRVGNVVQDVYPSDNEQQCKSFDKQVPNRRIKTPVRQEIPQSAKVGEKKTDWSELDMYQKHRENLVKDDTDAAAGLSQVSAMEENLDSQVLRDEGPKQSHNDTDVPIYMWDDSLAQVTDYGLTYICEDDLSEIPQDWDDKRTLEKDAWAVNDRPSHDTKKRMPVRRRTGFGRASHTLPRHEATKGQDGPSSLYHARYFPPCGDERTHQSVNRWVDDSPEIVDVSDESFEDCAKHENQPVFIRSDAKATTPATSNVSGARIQWNRPSDSLYNRGRRQSESKYGDSAISGGTERHVTVGRKCNSETEVFNHETYLSSAGLNHMTPVGSNYLGNGAAGLFNYTKRDTIDIKRGQHFANSEANYKNEAWCRNGQKSHRYLQGGFPHVDASEISKNTINDQTSYDTFRKFDRTSNELLKPKRYGTLTDKYPGIVDYESNSAINKSDMLPSRSNKAEHQREEQGGSDKFYELSAFDTGLYGDESEMKHDSKWTNYFSSQSSTASECLNWRYPITNGNNQVVMEKYGPGDTVDTPTDARHTIVKHGRQVTELDKFLPDGKGDRNVKMISKPLEHGELAQEVKYGQVLAWVSNSQSQRSVDSLDKDWEVTAETSVSKPETATNPLKQLVTEPIRQAGKEAVRQSGAGIGLVRQAEIEPIRQAGKEAVRQSGAGIGLVKQAEIEPIRQQKLRQSEIVSIKPSVKPSGLESGLKNSRWTSTDRLGREENLDGIFDGIF